MANFAYKGRTMLDVAIRLLELSIDDDTYLAVLGTLADGVRTAKSRLDRANELGFEQFAEPLIDLETALVENLLGATYVVCQAQITAIAQAAIGVREAAIAEGRAFNGFGAKPQDVRALGPKFDATYSKLEILWVLANCFKHRDEWDAGTWQSPDWKSKATIDTIKAAGLQESSTGNLRTGARALGNATFDDMKAFGDVISEWASDVRQRIRVDVGR